MSNSENEVFNKEAIRILKKTQETREALLDGYLKKGIEKLTAEDLDVVTKLTDSMDKQVHTNARIALAKRDSDNMQDYTELVRNILTAPLVPRETNPVLPDKLSKIDATPDELSFEREEFQIEDFLRTEDD